MIRIHERVAADASRVWDVLVDTRLWPRWGPSVVAVDHRPRHLGACSRGRVRLPVGAWLPFRVTEFVPGHYFRWNVAGVPATGHRVVDLGGNQSRLTFEVPLWAAPYALVCKYAGRRLARLAEARS